MQLAKTGVFQQAPTIVGTEFKFFRCTVETAIKTIEQVLSRSAAYGPPTLLPTDDAAALQRKLFCLPDDAFKNRENLKAAVRPHLNADISIFCNLCKATVQVKNFVSHYDKNHGQIKWENELRLHPLGFTAKWRELES